MADAPKIMLDEFSIARGGSAVFRLIWTEPLSPEDKTDLLDWLKLVERRIQRKPEASGLSDFVRNATDERKAEVYGKVMDKVCRQQQAVIDGVSAVDGQTFSPAGTDDQAQPLPAAPPPKGEQQ